MARSTVVAGLPQITQALAQRPLFPRAERGRGERDVERGGPRRRRWACGIVDAFSSAPLGCEGTGGRLGASGGEAV